MTRHAKSITRVERTEMLWMAWNLIYYGFRSHRRILMFGFRPQIKDGLRHTQFKGLSMYIFIFLLE